MMAPIKNKIEKFLLINKRIKPASINNVMNCNGTVTASIYLLILIMTLSSKNPNQPFIWAETKKSPKLLFRTHQKLLPPMYHFFKKEGKY